MTLKKKSYTENLFFYINLPYYHVNSLMYLFWISFIASVNLFFFYFYYLYFFTTTDVFFYEFLFLISKFYITTLNSVPYYFVWFLLIFSLLLKCGIAPFHSWKPNFFKGVSFLNLIVYILFFYFFLFLFLLIFISNYYLTVILSFSLITHSLVIVGIGCILINLYKVTYVKSFFAMSSILNSLFVLLVWLNPTLNTIYL